MAQWQRGSEARVGFGAGILQQKMFDSNHILAAIDGSIIIAICTNLERSKWKAIRHDRVSGLAGQLGVKSHGAPKSQTQVRLACRI